jgi:hypothetical protein
MNSRSLKTTLAIMAMTLSAVCLFQTRSAQSSSATTTQVSPKPLLLEKK